MDQKFKGEECLRGSGVPYTVVRPGGLKDEPAGLKKLIAAQGDTASGSVSRADVAAVCVAALSDAAARNVTMELVTEKAAAAAAAGDGGGGASSVAVMMPLAEQIKNIFVGLKKD